MNRYFFLLLIVFLVASCTETTNTAPIANTSVENTDEDTSVIIDLSASDAENDALTHQIAEQPSNGTATLDGGQVTYTPNADYSGTDQFVFLVDDSDPFSNEAMVSIIVSGVNHFYYNHCCAELLNDR